LALDAETNGGALGVVVARVGQRGFDVSVGDAAGAEIACDAVLALAADFGALACELFGVAGVVDQAVFAETGEHYLREEFAGRAAFEESFHFRDRVRAAHERALGGLVEFGFGVEFAGLAEHASRIAPIVTEAAALHRAYPTLTYADRLELYHGGREFQFMSVVGDANGTTVMYLPKRRLLVTGDVLSGPVPYYAPPLSQHANRLMMLARLDADVIMPGHGPAWRDKSNLNLELELLDSIVRQVDQAVQAGRVSVEEIEKTVDVENLRARFTHDDPALNAKFRRFVQGMVENTAREARDGRKLEY